jgi:hypothetical protein
MKIPQKSSRLQKQRVVALTAVLIIVAIVSAYAFFARPNDTPQPADDAQTSIDQASPAVTPAPAALPEDEAADKKSFIEGQDSEEDQGDSVEKGLRIDLSASRDSDGFVVVSTKLYGTSDGQCRLRISNNTKSTTRTAEVLYQPSFSTCAGFSLPMEELGSGVWDISLRVTTSRNQEITKTITKEVR